MTVDNLMHKLWTLRATEVPYSKAAEKPLWIALQKFVEKNGGLTQQAEGV